MCISLFTGTVCIVLHPDWLGKIIADFYTAHILGCKCWAVCVELIPMYCCCFHASFLAYSFTSRGVAHKFVHWHLLLSVASWVVELVKPNVASFHNHCRLVYLMVPYYLDNRGNSRANTCRMSRAGDDPDASTGQPPFPKAPTALHCSGRGVRDVFFEKN